VIATGIRNCDYIICFPVVVRLKFTTKNFSVIIENLRNEKRLDDYTSGIENSDGINHDAEKRK
jgi:hypothetical protein